MKILLLPVGSSGDVHPFVGIGIILKKRGHHVTFITNGFFRSVAERAGLEFVEFGTAEEYLALADNPDLWHPTRSLDLLTKMMGQAAKPMTEIIKNHTVPHQTIVVAGTLALGARIAEDAWKIPTAMIHLQPGILRSVIDPPKFPTLSIPAWFPGPVIKFLYRIVDFAFDRKIAGPINEVRAELGLPPVRSIMGDFWHSPRLTIGLWPDWYGAPQKDWPAALRLTGFPLYDGEGAETTSPGLKEFLEKGPAPIVFTAGSAMRMGHDFFHQSVEAAKILGGRAVLITQFSEQIPKDLPDGIQHFSYVPFSKIFPHASVVVHHGGIGTTAQALRAGQPQLVVPMNHDQPDNAARVKKLGAGDYMSRRSYRANKVASVLKNMMRNKIIHQNCQAIAGRFGSNDLAKTCDLIEGLKEIRRG